MTLTLFAFFMLPVFLRMVLDSEGMREAIEDWGDSRGLQFMSTIILFCISALIFVSSSAGFSVSLKSLINWIGLAILIKGLAYMSPQVVEFKVRMLKESRLPMIGFVGLLMVLAFVYIDVQLI